MKAPKPLSHAVHPSFASRGSAEKPIEIDITPPPSPKRSPPKLIPYPTPESEDFSQTSNPSSAPHHASRLPSPFCAASSSSSSSARPTTCHQKCEVTTYGVKGLGVRAKQALRKGEIIVVEAPFVTFEHDKLEERARDMFNALPKRSQSLFLTFQATCPKLRDHHHNVCETNAIPLWSKVDDSNESSLSGLFETISRVCHACRPNAGWRWIPSAGLMELVSHRGIGKGEEITASYLSIEDLTLPGATRRKLLEDTFGFDCDCEICSPSDNLKVNRARRHREEASDHRMARYRRLFDQFGPTAHDPEHLRYWAFTMSEALTQINKAIVLLEEEHLLPEGALTAKVHVLMGWGRDRTARTVAKELHELHCLILGEEAALEEPLVKWMDDPTSCPSWKICIEDEPVSDGSEYEDS